MELQVCYFQFRAMILFSKFPPTPISTFYTLWAFFKLTITIFTLKTNLYYIYTTTNFKATESCGTLALGCEAVPSDYDMFIFAAVFIRTCIKTRLLHTVYFLQECVTKPLQIKALWVFVYACTHATCVVTSTACLAFLECLLLL